MKKNVLISTGGSGGHVIPAIILHEHLTNEANVIITSDKRGLKFFDYKIYNHKIINTPKLDNIFFLPFNLIILLFLVIKSTLLLKAQKIESTVSTGGYMSLPLIFASKLLRIKIFLIEPNLVLGRANRFFLNSCLKIFCYSDEIKNFPRKFKDKIIIINPLVRKNFFQRKIFDENKKKINILIIGGSQGAKIFDQSLKYKISNLSKKFSIKIIQQTSLKNIDELKRFYNKNNIENLIFSFDSNLHEIMKKADLCITRAGASTLAELSALNIPFITIPLPTSVDDHQKENAKYYERNNCCWIVEQKTFDDKIEDVLIEILENKQEYQKKKENLKKLNNQNTWINVNQKILWIINEN